MSVRLNERPRCVNAGIITWHLHSLAPEWQLNVSPVLGSKKKEEKLRRGQRKDAVIQRAHTHSTAGRGEGCITATVDGMEFASLPKDSLDNTEAPDDKTQKQIIG